MQDVPDAVRLYARAHRGVNPRDDRARHIELFNPETNWWHHYRVPSAAHVARYFFARHLNNEAPVYRSADDGIVRLIEGKPQPISREDLAASLTDLLAAMPERVFGIPELGQSDLYRGLRAYARLAPADEVDTYLAAVLDALPRALKPLPAPKAPRAPRPAPMTPAERKRVSRARRRERELATARAYLEMWSDEADVVVTRAELVDGLINFADEAVEAFEDAERQYVMALGKWNRARFEERQDAAPQPLNEWPEIVEEMGYPEHPVTVTPRRAIALFRELGLAETRSGNERRYRLPQPEAREENSMPTIPDDEILADALLDRVAALAWAEQREVLLGVLARRRDAVERPRELLAATGTDGAVIDAAERFLHRKEPRL
ncbi:hypothetical protein [Microbacterium sp.]|uniref:hypothetical protein n=1 Tax=Microbacterium sp. TaxID=51671 RepID=UPI0037C901EB